MTTKNIMFFSICILCLCFITGCQSDTEGNPNLSESAYPYNDMIDISEYMTDEVLPVIDYPLADIYFDRQNEWDIFLVKNSYESEPEVFRFQGDMNDMQDVKQYLLITTVPSGQGTTTNGEIYIFKNGKMHRDIEYLLLEIRLDSLRECFIKSSLEELETHKLSAKESSGVKLRVEPPIKNDVYPIIDYPLNDIYFNSKEADFDIIFTSEVYDYDLEKYRQEYYIFEGDANEIQFLKQGLLLFMFPVGKDTMSNGKLYIYKDRKLQKDIEYIALSFREESLKNYFVKSSKEQFESLINR